MSRLRYLTAGESHGPGLTAVLDGCPAGLDVDVAAIDAELGRRQSGYGRGERQSIEQDRVRVLGGVRHGRTTGAPLALFVPNRDASNWGDVLAVEAPPAGGEAAERVVIPRPGHADLGGALLYELEDIRDVIERASARETAAKVACGAVAKALLATLGCTVASHVVALGGVTAESGLEPGDVARVEASPVRCADEAAGQRMIAAIDEAAAAGDTLGGVVEVLAFGYPPGVGSYVQGDRRLQSRLAAAVLAVPAIRGMEFGLGFAAAGLPGSRVHDPLGLRPRAWLRAREQPGRRHGGRHLDRRDHRRARGDEAHLDAEGASGQRGDGLAPAGQVPVRAIRRLRGPGGRHRPRGRDRAHARGRGARALRGRHGRRRRRRRRRLQAAHPGALSRRWRERRIHRPSCSSASWGRARALWGVSSQRVLRVPFLDTDEAIVAVAGSIPEIFAVPG